MKSKKEIEEVEAKIRKLIDMLIKDNEDVKKKRKKERNAELMKIYDILIKTGERDIAKLSFVAAALEWVLGKNKDFKETIDEYTEMLEGAEK
jgi:hypothetical protein